MQLRRHGFQLLVLLITLTAFDGGSSAQLMWPCPPKPVLEAVVVTSQPNAICSAALSGLRELPDLVTDKNAPMLGFKNKAEASSARNGKPFKLYQVNLVDLRHFNPDTDKVKDLLKPTSLSIHPILTTRQEDGEQVRAAMVVLEQKDNTARTTNWGLAQLAQAMTRYRVVSGFEDGVVVWIPALNLHFLGNKPLDEGLLLIPLADRLAYGIRRGNPISAKTVFTFYAREANTLDEDNPG